MTSKDKSMNWHENCFTCDMCKKSLYITGFYPHEGGIYCDKCMDERLGHVCRKCQEPIRQYSKFEEVGNF